MENGLGSLRYLGDKSLIERKKAYKTNSKGLTYTLMIEKNAIQLNINLCRPPTRCFKVLLI